VPLAARNALLLPRAGAAGAGRALRLFAAALADGHFSAAEAAGKAATGALLGLPAWAQAAAGAAFLRAADAPLPRKVPPPAAGGDAPASASASASAAYRAYRVQLARALRRRTAGALGVASIVRAHPFDVPPFLPGLLSAFGRHSADPQPVAGVVRAAMADFKASHADRWREDHVAAFTAEQLEELAEHLSSGSYFL